MLNLSPPSPFEARDRVLSDQELALIWKASASLGYPWAPCFRLLMLTGQRRDEVAAMHWRELDFVNLQWIIPSSRTKNGREHVVHLSPLAEEQLLELNRGAPRTESGRRSSPYVFTTTMETHVSGFSKAKLLLDKNVKLINDNNEISPWRIHDIRRTVATGMRGLNVPPHIIEKILNHTSGVNGGIVGVYQRYEDIEERRDALNKWSNHISSLVSSPVIIDTPASNVFAFKLG